MGYKYSLYVRMHDSQTRMSCIYDEQNDISEIFYNQNWARKYDNKIWIVVVVVVVYKLNVRWSNRHNDAHVYTVCIYTRRSGGWSARQPGQERSACRQI